MRENVIENLLINIKPIMINSIVIISIIMIFVGIIVTIYGLYKKKWTVSNALKYFLSTTVLGLFVSTTGVLITIICEYDINTVSYQCIIPIGYTLSLCILGLLLANKSHQKNKR